MVDKILIVKLAALALAYIVLMLVCLRWLREPMPTWFRRNLFKHSFDRFQWYRSWYGGTWTLWYIEECLGDIWFHNLQCRPMSSRGTPIIERYDD